MYNSTIYYNLKRSIYRYRWSINIHMEKIRLGFNANLLCPFSFYLGFRFASSLHLYILSVCLKYATNLSFFYLSISSSIYLFFYLSNLLIIYSCIYLILYLSIILIYYSNLIFLYSSIYLFFY